MVNTINSLRKINETRSDNGLRGLLMVTVFPKSANELNGMALTICNCFWLMRDWKLENLANGKEVSTVPFDRKSHLLCFVYFPVSTQG